MLGAPLLRAIRGTDWILLARVWQVRDYPLMSSGVGALSMEAGRVYDGTANASVQDSTILLLVEVTRPPRFKTLV